MRKKVQKNPPVEKVGGARTVRITEKDIAKAQKGNSYKCVVAQAIARTFPNGHHIEVDTQTIRFTDGTKRFAYLTPAAVQGYVVAFDAGDAIEPFAFQLRQRVPVRQPKPVRRSQPAVTRQAIKASDRVRKRAVKARRSDPTINPKEAARAAYVAAKEQALAQYPGAIHEPDPAARKATPRVFKTKKRTYGMRVLRINREQAAADEAARELEANDADL